MQLHLDKVLEAITASRKALELKIDTVVIDMNLLMADQSKLADRITNNEMTLAEVQPLAETNSMKIESLTGRMTTME